MKTWHAVVHLQNGGRYWTPFEWRGLSVHPATAMVRALKEALDDHKTKQGRKRITGYKLTLFPTGTRPAANALPMNGLGPKEVDGGQAKGTLGQVDAGPEDQHAPGPARPGAEGDQPAEGSGGVPTGRRAGGPTPPGPQASTTPRFHQGE